jgi:aminopeptidase N
VVWAAGRHGGAQRFEQLLARLKSAPGEEDRWTYAMALAAGTDETRARALLAASLTDIAPPNIATALPGLVSDESPFGDLAYAWTLAHWAELARINGSSMWGRYWLLPSAADRFNETARAAALIEDQQRLTGPDGAAPAARTAARISLRAAVRARDAAALETLLASW